MRKLYLDNIQDEVLWYQQSSGGLGVDPSGLLIPTDISLFPDPPVVDLFPQNSCVALADHNSTNDWTPNGAQLAINSGDTAPLSTYSLSVYSYAPGGQDYAQILVPVTAGLTYSLSYWTKFIPGGLPNPNARMSTWLGVTASPDVDLTPDTEWTRKTVEFEAIANPVYMRFWVVADTHDGTGDNLLLDRFVLQQVTMG